MAHRSVCVFMPSPILTITIEQIGSRSEQHHIHAGGQGFWVARMIRRLGVDVSMAAPFGGDTGATIRHLIELEGVDVRATEVRAENGSYIHDRRGGQRIVISQVPGAPLSRHELDDLYDATITEALDSAVLVLTGPSDEGIVPNHIYTRLARDARNNGITVVADMSGSALEAALEGGIDVLKVSHEELLNMNMIRNGSIEAVRVAVEPLIDRGARNLVITRADEASIASIDSELMEIHVPRFEPLDHRGAGDSMTAGIAAGLARGESLLEAFRLGAGAGALNVTRHGLGTGRRDDIERLAQHVEFRPVSTAPGAVAT